MSEKFNTDPIIVVIATSMKRTNLLYERSLKSVYQQENINPHQIYIVDDNDTEKLKNSDEFGKITRIVETLKKELLRPKFVEKKKEFQGMKFDNFFHTTVIQNIRTKGYSGTGAWNSAAFKAMQYSGRNYFLAFLDDDDEWNKNYLNTLYATVKNPKKKLIKEKIKDVKSIAVVSGFLRKEKKKTEEIQANKKNFTKEEFFISNPGLQGSNLFIGLKTFWKIGGFDESLKSATDRDLAIRLIAYAKLRPSKKIEFVDRILVTHYAISEDRVTANLENKKQGLDVFYRKYWRQFPKELQQKSLARAKLLFNYNLDPEIKSIEKPPIIIPAEEKKNVDPFNLIIGTISDSAKNLTELFKSFFCLHKEYGEIIKDYRFLVLENTKNEYEIRPVIHYFKVEKKLKIKLIENKSEKLTIAKSRTFLQKEVYKKGEKLFAKKYISWIVDDDNAFRYDTPNKQEKPNYFKIIAEQSKCKIDAMFGLISDAPPLPFLNTLRTQLLDFYYNLSYFANCDPEKKYELSRLQQNNISKEEFYYDLSSKNFQHLEYPDYWQSKEENNSEAFKKFIVETALLSDGVNVFRKITHEPETIGKITRDSIYRGGNTIIFNPELLKTENYTQKQEYNRRSDFNWAIINKYIFGRKLKEIILPLQHNRELQRTSLVTNKDKLEADIQGLVFYRLLKEILSKENWQEKKDHKTELKFYKKINKETFTKIKINTHRIISLTYSILAILKDVKLWWYKAKYRENINHLIQQNIFTMDVLQFELGKRKLQIFVEDLEKKIKKNETDIKSIVKEIKTIKDNLSL